MPIPPQHGQAPQRNPSTPQFRQQLKQQMEMDGPLSQTNLSRMDGQPQDYMARQLKTTQIGSPTHFLFFDPWVPVSKLQNPTNRSFSY